jgi:streptogramin lyase
MQTRAIFSSVAVVFTAAFFTASGAFAQGTAQSALAGSVSSSGEAAMEGVLVSAKKDGSTVTITVVSDNKGRYSFPASKLSPGHYALKVRAVGYDLVGPKDAEVTSGKATTADLNLRTTRNVAAQLTNAEWLMSFPGSEDQKKFLYGCTSCHTLQRIAMSSHDGDEFLHQVMVRMAGYSSMAFPLSPQVRHVPRDMSRGFGTDAQKMANWLSTVNLSQTEKWEYSFKTLSRPTGPATRVIITEYDLPRQVTQPHDVVLDKDGTVWFSEFGENNLGRMDPKTGKVTEYPIPTMRGGFPTGNLDLEFDREDNLWIGLMMQTGVAKFDRKTGKFEIFKIPGNMLSEETQQAMVAATNWEVDGKVWMNDVEKVALGRLDVKTGSMDPWLRPYASLPKGEPHSIYGVYTDSRNNVFFMDFSSTNIGRVDAKTGEIKLFPTPTPKSRPRRGRMDAQDRLWFAEWRADKIGMFDTKTGEFKEWAIPSPYSAPYDVVLDKNQEVWAGGMTDDLVLRLDTKTGNAVEYLLPRETNIRRVFVDNSTNPVTFWTGSNHGASIVKLEPLD